MIPMLGAHNRGVMAALLSAKPLVWVYGPSGVGKTFCAKACERPGDVLIDFATGDTLTLPDAPRVIITATMPPREAGLPDDVLARIACGLIVRHNEWSRDDLALYLTEKAPDLPDDAVRAVLEINDTPALLNGVACAWETLKETGPWHEVLSAYMRVNAVRNVVAHAGTIIDTVAACYGLRTADLLGPWRTKPTAHARHVACYALRHLARMAHTEIGLRMGNRDHSTVIHAVNKITRRMMDDAAVRSEVETVLSRCRRNVGVSQ